MDSEDQRNPNRSDPSVRERSPLRALLRGLARHVHGFYATTGVALSAGLTLALLALWGLSALTEDVLEGDTEQFDRSVLLWLEEQSTGWLDRAALEITVMADTLVIVLVAVVAASLLWLLGQKAHAWLVVLAVGGAAIITPVLKAVFDRPRPQVFELRGVFAEHSAAYPSGHATMSMVTLVTIAFIVHRLSDRKRTSVIAALLAGMTILLIGMSRMYLGLHFPSDVLAGYAIGFAWAIFCAVTIKHLAPTGRPPRSP